MGILVRSPFSKLLISWVLALFVIGSIVTVSPQTAWAQEEAKTEEKGKKELPSLPEHLIKSLGWFFGPLLLIISILLVTLIVLLAMDLRLASAIPPGFVDEFTDLVNKRQFKQAFELCKNDGSFLARVLTAGMGRLQYGIEDARECAMNMMESVRAGKETLNSYLATIGTLGPLIGLVGTVSGMIESFRELATGETPRPERLADGISHALVVTLFGIALSVPAIFCYALFKSRMTRLSMDTANLADDLLTQMYHNSRRTATGSVTSADSRPASSQVTEQRPS